MSVSNQAATYRVVFRRREKGREYRPAYYVETNDQTSVSGPHMRRQSAVRALREHELVDAIEEVEKKISHGG